MIEPQQVEDGCVEIVHVDRILGDLEAKLVSLSVDLSRPRAAPG